MQKKYRRKWQKCLILLLAAGVLSGCAGEEKGVGTATETPIIEVPELSAYMGSTDPADISDDKEMTVYYDVSEYEGMEETVFIEQRGYQPMQATLIWDWYMNEDGELAVEWDELVERMWISYEGFSVGVAMS